MPTRHRSRADEAYIARKLILVVGMDIFLSTRNFLFCQIVTYTCYMSDPQWSWLLTRSPNIIQQARWIRERSKSKNNAFCAMKQHHQSGISARYHAPVCVGTNFLVSARLMTLAFAGPSGETVSLLETFPMVPVCRRAQSCGCLAEK